MASEERLCGRLQVFDHRYPRSIAGFGKRRRFNKELNGDKRFADLAEMHLQIGIAESRRLLTISTYCGPFHYTKLLVDVKANVDSLNPRYEFELDIPKQFYNGKSGDSENFHVSNKLTDHAARETTSQVPFHEREYVWATNIRSEMLQEDSWIELIWPHRAGVVRFVQELTNFLLREHEAHTGMEKSRLANYIRLLYPPTADRLACYGVAKKA
ncbi:hypothetical protein CLF_103692 [Clonorchis sinensis]|uniref:Uncharacterized protein n=1 Tax=Clonorchis sinensis TaxID=79923 RepID=G7YA79_CLOSI|nr:hypothetical protein CLF_103692 [Clonorchis sinensis]